MDTKNKFMARKLLEMVRKRSYNNITISDGRKMKLDTAEKYMALFCKKTGTAESYVRKWLPIVAASQSVRGSRASANFCVNG